MPLGSIPRRKPIGPATPVGPNPYSGLASVGSVSRGLAIKPQGLMTHGKYQRTQPATQKETVPFGNLEGIQSRRTLPAHPSETPHSGVPWRHTLSLTLTLTHPPTQSPGKHDTVLADVAEITLGHYPNPRLASEGSVPRGLAPKSQEMGHLSNTRGLRLSPRRKPHHVELRKALRAGVHCMHIEAHLHFHWPPCRKP